MTLMALRNAWGFLTAAINVLQIQIYIFLSVSKSSNRKVTQRGGFSNPPFQHNVFQILKFNRGPFCFSKLSQILKRMICFSHDYMKKNKQNKTRTRCKVQAPEFEPSSEEHLQVVTGKKKKRSQIWSYQVVVMQFLSSSFFCHNPYYLFNDLKRKTICGTSLVNLQQDSNKTAHMKGMLQHFIPPRPISSF